MYLNVFWGFLSFFLPAYPRHTYLYASSSFSCLLFVWRSLGDRPPLPGCIYASAAGYMLNKDSNLWETLLEVIVVWNDEAMELNIRLGNNYRITLARGVDDVWALLLALCWAIFTKADVFSAFQLEWYPKNSYGINVPLHCAYVML